MVVDVNDRVATVTLNSPTNRNALSRQLLIDLHEALDQALQPGVRVVVLTHVGSVFCSGIDLKERVSGNYDGTPMAEAFARLMRSDVPTVAAVKGAVRAGGVGLMASCDLVVVQPDVTFAFTEVRIGVAPAMIAVPILRRVNAQRLAAPFLTGEAFDASDAVQMGLVTHVAADVDATVADLCDAIRKGAPGAITATKALLRALPGVPVDEALAAMRGYSDELFATAEAREGMAAFFGKRPPRWSL